MPGCMAGSVQPPPHIRRFFPERSTEKHFYWVSILPFLCIRSPHRYGSNRTSRCGLVPFQENGGHFRRVICNSLSIFLLRDGYLGFYSADMFQPFFIQKTECSLKNIFLHIDSPWGYPMIERLDPLHPRCVPARWGFSLLPPPRRGMIAAERGCFLCGSIILQSVTCTSFLCQTERMASNTLEPCGKPAILHRQKQITSIAMLPGVTTGILARKMAQPICQNGSFFRCNCLQGI